MDQWFQWLIKYDVQKADLIVYLQTDPEVCIERMRNRGRSEETGISLEWLREVHKLHENWLLPSTVMDSNEKRFPIPARKVYVVDANKNGSEADHFVPKMH